MSEVGPKVGFPALAQIGSSRAYGEKQNKGFLGFKVNESQTLQTLRTKAHLHVGGEFDVVCWLY